MTIESRSLSKFEKIVDFLLLGWVSSIGRVFVSYLFLNKKVFPKTDSLSFETNLTSQSGVLEKFWFTFKTFLFDIIYFLFGLSALFILYIALMYLLPAIFGPINF